LIDAYGTGNPVLNFRKAQGTAASASAAGYGNTIGTIQSFGYGATAYSTASRATIQSVAEENWTDAAQGTRWGFFTTANGTTTVTERMRITESGRIGINTTSPSANLDVTGNINITTAATVAGMNVVPTVQAAYDKANTSVQNNATTLITVGYTVQPWNAGVNVAAYGTWTPNPANGNYQFANSNGAFTLAAPSTNCAIDVLFSNGTGGAANGARAITFSGFKVQSGGTGDTYSSSTANAQYILSIRRINNISTYVWKALQ
jgi:hypothetical protein